MPPPPGAATFTPADLNHGATEDEVLRWLSPHAAAPTLLFGDLAGRFDLSPRPAAAAATAAASADAATPAHAAASADAASTSAAAGVEAQLGRGVGHHGKIGVRLDRGVAYREEILRHVRQQARLRTAPNPFFLTQP